MAQIDPILAELIAAGGEEVLLGSGRPICFLVSGSVRPRTNAPATTEAIVRVLSEILPEASKASLSASGQADFAYRSPEGSDFQVHLEHSGGTVFARMRREPEAAPVAELDLGVDAESTGALGSPLETARDFDFDGSSESLDLEATLEPQGSLGAALADAGAQAAAPPPPDAALAALAAAANAFTSSFSQGSPILETPETPAPVAEARRETPAPKSPGGGGMILPLLKFLVTRQGSDLHIAPDSPPRVRMHGALLPLETPPLTSAQTSAVLDTVLSTEQLERFRRELSLDFSFSIPQLGRFRANACISRRGVSLVFRAIGSKIPTLAELGLPKSVETLTTYPNGLILVTGPAGCGKTTTQAAIIDRINETWKDHIITIEDPIEYLHPPKNCLVNQREVGKHVRSFAEALKSALREDPDVILVGELRDLETIQLAITASETGHLVIGTLHTIDAAKTIDRLVDVFPGRQKVQIRGMVSESLRGVVSQQLIRTADGAGRVPAFEVLLSDRSVANLIREGKTFQIPNSIRLGRARGMCALDDSLLELHAKKLITMESVIEHASNPDAIRKVTERAPAPARRPGPVVPPGGKSS